MSVWVCHEVSCSVLHKEEVLQHFTQEAVQSRDWRTFHLWGIRRMKHRDVELWSWSLLRVEHIRNWEDDDLSMMSALLNQSVEMVWCRSLMSVTQRDLNLISAATECWWSSSEAQRRELQEPGSRSVELKQINTQVNLYKPIKSVKAWKKQCNRHQSASADD